MKHFLEITKKKFRKKKEKVTLNDHSTCFCFLLRSLKSFACFANFPMLKTYSMKFLTNSVFLKIIFVIFDETQINAVHQSHFKTK